MGREHVKTRCGNRPRPRLGFPLFVLCVTALAGCASLGNSTRPTPPPAANPLTQTPTADDLVGYLNRNAARITAVEARDLDIDIKAQNQAIGLSGTLYCQQPKNFRMK